MDDLDLLAALDPGGGPVLAAQDLAVELDGDARRVDLQLAQKL
jgi:hypothetical protein